MDNIPAVQFEILDTCLSRIQSGQASFKDSLRDHQEHTEELMPLLELADQTHSRLSPPGPSEEFTSTSRIRLLNQLRSAARPRPTIQAKPAPRWRWIWRPAYRLLSVFLALILVATSTGVAWASSDALPGDILYGVKRGIEETRLALTRGPARQAALLTQFATERLEELETILAANRTEDADAALSGYEDMIQRLTELSANSTLSSDPGSLEHIQSNLDHHQEVLLRVQAQAPAAAQDAIENALERSKHSKQVIEGLQQGGSPSELAPGQLKKTDPSDQQEDDKGHGKPDTKTPKPKKNEGSQGRPPRVTPGPKDKDKDKTPGPPNRGKKGPPDDKKK